MKCLARLMLGVIGTSTMIACAESPIAPTGVHQSALVTVTAQPVEGFYDLRFLNTSHVEVANLQFGQALILQAHITDAGGNPAQGGSVVFQYCSLKGYPPNDIEHVDEAPLEKCEVTGEGTWAHLATRDVDTSGNAEMTFCCSTITPTIGFRFKYLGQGSGIANRTSGPENFNWY